MLFTLSSPAEREQPRLAAKFSNLRSNFFIFFILFFCQGHQSLNPACWKPRAANEIDLIEIDNDSLSILEPKPFAQLFRPSSDIQTLQQ